MPSPAVCSRPLIIGTGLSQPPQASQAQRADSRKERKTRENSQEKAQCRLRGRAGSRQGTRRSAPGRFADKPLPGGAESPRSQGARPHPHAERSPAGPAGCDAAPALTSPQPIRRMRMSGSRPLLNLDCEPSHCTILSERDTQCFEAGGRRVPFPSRVITLPFSTSPKALSLRFDSGIGV